MTLKLNKDLMKIHISQFKIKEVQLILVEL